VNIHFVLTPHSYRRDTEIVEVWDMDESPRLVAVIYPEEFGLKVISKYMTAPPRIDTGIVPTVGLNLKGEW
jgi:hypothetical protein